MSSTNDALRKFIIKKVDVAKHFSRFPQFTDVKTRLQHLEKHHVDKQVAGMHNLIDPNVLPIRIEEVSKTLSNFQ